VRRKRRVEIHIEHREISIFSSYAPQPVPPVHPYQPDSARILQLANPGCPTCGSPELVLLTEAVTHARLDLIDLNQRMQDGLVHYHRSPSGEWWLCSKSLARS